MNLRHLGELIVGTRAQDALEYQRVAAAGGHLSYLLVSMESGARVELWADVRPGVDFGQYVMLRLMLSACCDAHDTFVTAWSDTQVAQDPDHAIGCLLARACRELSTMQTLADLITEDDE